jgi:hypothetical protein
MRGAHEWGTQSVMSPKAGVLPKLAVFAGYSHAPPPGFRIDLWVNY